MNESKPEGRKTLYRTVKRKILLSRIPKKTINPKLKIMVDNKGSPYKLDEPVVAKMLIQHLNDKINYLENKVQVETAKKEIAKRTIIDIQEKISNSDIIACRGCTYYFGEHPWISVTCPHCEHVFCFDCFQDHECRFCEECAKPVYKINHGFCIKCLRLLCSFCLQYTKNNNNIFCAHCADKLQIEIIDKNTINKKIEFD